MSRDYTSKHIMLEQYCKTEGLSTDYFIYSMRGETNGHYFKKFMNLFRKHV